MEAAEESDHRLEADAAGEAESHRVVVGFALKMARVASLNKDGREGAGGGEERADVAEEEANENEEAHLSQHELHAVPMVDVTEFMAEDGEKFLVGFGDCDYFVGQDDGTAWKGEGVGACSKFRNSM